MGSREHPLKLEEKVLKIAIITAGFDGKPDSSFLDVLLANVRIEYNWKATKGLEQES